MVDGLEPRLAKISVVIMPPEQISVRPVCSSVGKPYRCALQAQIFLSVVKDFLDLIANREGEVVPDRYVAGVEDRMNIFTKQYAV